MEVILGNFGPVPLGHLDGPFLLATAVHLKGLCSHYQHSDNCVPTRRVRELAIKDVYGFALWQRLDFIHTEALRCTLRPPLFDYH